MAQHPRHPSGDEVRAASSGLTRRRLVGRLAAGISAPALASILASGAWAQEATPTPALLADGDDDLRVVFDLDPRLIQYDPLTYGTPLELIDGLIVPNDRFFVRNNGPIPDLPADRYRLRVSGLVERPLELSLADLQAMPTDTRTMFLECSGNSRGFFQPNAAGTQWGHTAVGAAEWTGVSLAKILARAGVRAGAVDLVSRGGDFAAMRRGLPIGRALAPDVMVVWAMNGEPLPAVHGGPARLFVPGWGGIASTKWLVGLEVIDRVFDGPLNTESYVIVTEHGQPIRPVREMPVKSVIVSPSPGARLAAGRQTIVGFAWSGYAGIRRVEVSTTGGLSWSDARIVAEAGPLAWVRFELDWAAPVGPTNLHARATDAAGLTQPDAAPWNAKGYQYNAVVDVPVTVA